MTSYLMNSVSVYTSQRRVEIQTTSVINCLLHILLAQLNAYQLFRPAFQPFQCQ